MDVADALADLAEVSPHLVAALVLDPDGTVAGSHPASGPRAQGLADAARRLVEHAERVSSGRSPVKELEVATRGGSVFVVRESGWTIAAATTRGAPTALVRADLGTCVRRLAQAREAAAAEPAPPEPKPKRTRAGATPKTTTAKKSAEHGAAPEAPDPKPKPPARKRTAPKASPPKNAAGDEATPARRTTRRARDEDDG